MEATRARQHHLENDDLSKELFKYSLAGFAFSVLVLSLVLYIFNIELLRALSLVFLWAATLPTLVNSKLPPYLAKIASYNSVAFFSLAAALSPTPFFITCSSIGAAYNLYIRANWPKAIYIYALSVLSFLLFANLTLSWLNLGRFELYVVLNILAVVAFLAVGVMFHKLQHQLSTMRREASEADRRLEENVLLIRSICHDIASPLFAITSSTHILNSEEELSKKEKVKFFNIIDNSLENMTLYIHRVREFILAKGCSDKNEVSNIYDVLSGIKEDYASKAKKKQIAIDLNNVSKNINIKGESKILKKAVFGNIIDNAIKYSHPGTTISISTNTRSEFSGSSFRDVDIDISDEGVGIRKSFIDGLFEAHSKTTSKGTQGENGSGYGLAISEKTAKLMGMSLVLQSTNADKTKGPTGTTFRVTSKIESELKPQ